MLTIETSRQPRTRDRIGRRDFLRVGTLGVAGLSLVDLMQLQAASENENGSYLKDRAIILLFLAGGPSQHETFDPKPNGPDTSTSFAGHLATKLPGIRFATYFPKMARLADKLTIVRSFQTHHAEHNGAHKQILTGDLSVKDGKPIHEPGPGPAYASIAGTVNPQTGAPRNAIIPPTTRYLPEKAGFAGAYDSVVEGSRSAWLGTSYDPFEIKVPMKAGVPKEKKKRKGQEEEPNHLVENLKLQVTEQQLNDRMNLLKQVDQIGRLADSVEANETLTPWRRQALDVLRGQGLRHAVDLSREDPKTLAAYDTEHFRNYRCNDKSKFERNGPSIGISLGRQLLMARRLCEVGCGFVTVIHANWDFHARKGIPNIPEGMSVLAPPVDHAVDAFLRDVEARGLRDKILLVITGEFGRTPKLDKNLGRHHWPRLCPLVFAGGGLKHGQVIGQSDTRGGEPATEPITIDDFQATLMNAMFDVGRLRLDSSVPQKIQARAQRGKAITELF